MPRGGPIPSRRRGTSFIPRSRLRHYIPFPISPLFAVTHTMNASRSILLYLHRTAGRGRRKFCYFTLPPALLCAMTRYAHSVSVERFVYARRRTRSAALTPHPAPRAWLRCRTHRAPSGTDYFMPRITCLPSLRNIYAHYENITRAYHILCGALLVRITPTLARNILQRSALGMVVGEQNARTCTTIADACLHVLFLPDFAPYRYTHAAQRLAAYWDAS